MIKVTIHGKDKKNLKSLITGIYILLRPFLLGLSKAETYLSKKWVEAAYHRMFMLQWQFSFGKELEYFYHEMDLFYQFPVKSEAGWLERGILNRIALMAFENPIAMELCCGDGFNAKHFYAPCCDSLLCVDYDEEVLNVARKKNKASNIEYRETDIMMEMPWHDGEGFHNIICDAALAYFSESEIIDVINNVKKRLQNGGVFSGVVGVEYHEGGYHFKGVDDLRRFLAPCFNNVWVYENGNHRLLYFEASDGKLPLS